MAFEGAVARPKPRALLEETSYCVHKIICSLECTWSSKKLSQKALKEIKLSWEEKEGLGSFLLEIFSLHSKL